MDTQEQNQLGFNKLICHLVDMGVKLVNIRSTIQPTV